MKYPWNKSLTKRSNYQGYCQYMELKIMILMNPSDFICTDEIIKK